MLVLPSADSLWVRLPYLEHAIPAASFWSLIGSVVTLFGTLSIAVVVYRLGQTQFRSNRWWQLQEERYTAIVNELGTIRDAAAKLARYDEPDVMPEDITVTYTPEETEAFRNQILQALDVLRSEIQRGVLLLSPKAIEALRGYVRIAEQPISMEVQYRETAAWRLADKAYNEFAYIAQRDLSAPGSLSARQKAGTAALRETLGRRWYAWNPEFNLKMIQDFKTSFRVLRLMWEGRPAPGRPPVPRGKRIMRWIKQNFLTIQE